MICILTTQYPVPLRLASISHRQTSAAYPVEIASTRGQPRLNPTICPTNPDLMAYVEDGDIWLANMRTG